MDIGLIRMRYTPYGGGEVFLSRFIDALVKNGHTCHLFTAGWNKDVRECIVLHKVKTFGPSFLRLWLFALNSYCAVKKANLDVIVSFDRTLYQDICRAGDGCHKEWLLQRRKIISPLKKLFTFLNPLHLTILYLEKRLFQNKRLKFVIANSSRGKDEIIRHYGLPEGKIYVIYNGIDIKRFDSQERDNLRNLYREKLDIRDEIVLLFVGSGFERKGLKFLIGALGTLKKSGHHGLKLVVVGKGRIKKYLRMADRLGIGKDVQFTGPVSDVHGYYAASDIFVLPSIYEPFSNACLEAMANQLPIVTSRINGTSEILTHGKDGMIIDNPTHPEEIAERVKPFLNKEVRLSAGKMARITVENYTMQKNVEDVIKLIEVVR